MNMVVKHCHSFNDTAIRRSAHHIKSIQAKGFIMNKTLSIITYVIVFSVITLIVCACDESDHGGPFLYPNVGVSITVIDSLTGSPLNRAFVGEYSYDMQDILRGDSITDSSFYYKKSGFTSSRMLSFDYRSSGPDAPDYARYVAYMHGYRLWTYSKNRDTIKTVNGEQLLTIKMVK
jgi:hypothetical protein